jgi:GDP-4-dehydro-6-deoxy-D-mannose reductase
MPNQPTILVTGGSGFVGLHLIPLLTAKGYANIFATTFSDSAKLSELIPADHIRKVDLTDTEATARLIAELKPDWIFHLASFAFVGESFGRARELFANNINLQLSLLDAVKQHAPSARLLTIGSAEEYGVVETAYANGIPETAAFHPVNPYAVSKATQDLLAESYGLSFKLNILRTRSFNHIGAYQTDAFAIPAFAKQIVAIERGEQAKLKVGNLSAVRDFSDVDDTVMAYLSIMEKGTPGEVYNVGSGKGYTMSEVVEMLIKLASKPIELETDETRMRPLDVPRLIADNTKVRALGWQPTADLTKALQAVLEEWRGKKESS